MTQWKRCPICARKIDQERGCCTREGCPFRQKQIISDLEEEQKSEGNFEKKK